MHFIAPAPFFGTFHFLFRFSSRNLKYWSIIGSLNGKDLGRSFKIDSLFLFSSSFLRSAGVKYSLYIKFLLCSVTNWPLLLLKNCLSTIILYYNFFQLSIHIFIFISIFHRHFSTNFHILNFSRFKFQINRFFILNHSRLTMSWVYNSIIR